MYYRKANAAMIVYDITNEKTFDEAKLWVNGNYKYYNIILLLLLLLIVIFRGTE